MEDEELGMSHDTTAWCSEPEAIAAPPGFHADAPIAAAVEHGARGPYPIPGAYDTDTSSAADTGTSSAAPSTTPAARTSRSNRMHDARVAVGRVSSAFGAVDTIGETFFSGPEPRPGSYDRPRSPAASIISRTAGLLEGNLETAEGTILMSEGDYDRGVPTLVEGIGTTVSSSVGLASSEAGDILDATTDVATGAAISARGAVHIAEGDSGHGVPMVADGAVHAAIGAAPLGLGPLAGIDPVDGYVLETIADAATEGRALNEAAGTFGEIVGADGETRGMNSYEYAVSQYHDSQTTLHDYFADGAEEGSLRETAADVGSTVLGGIAGLGAGLIGFGGDLVAGFGAQPAIDSIWGALGVD